VVANPRPDDADSLTLFGLLVETSSALMDQTRRPIDDNGLAPSEFETLLRLHRTSGHRLRMADLAAQTGLSASGLTRLIDRLCSEGLVERESCPSDRRGAFAVLTERGRRRLDAVLPGHLELVDRHLTGVLTPVEAAQLEAILRKLRQVVRPEAVAGAV